MGETTAIGWCDHTFNPWRGCTHVSPGCEHCYAEAMARRVGGRHGSWGAGGARVVASEAYWRTPLRWNAKAAAAGLRRRVFCASMADVFEDRPDLVAPRGRLFDLIAETPALDWLLLTKRPGNVARLYDPQPNVWLGVSVEDQRRARERIPVLLAAPAVVRFVSAEPLLEPLDLGPWIGALDWVIVGGESGPQCRPMEPAWPRRLRDQCTAAGVAFFFKQWGGRTHAAGGSLLDGREWVEHPGGRP